jgi:hypothetical protein
VDLHGTLAPNFLVSTLSGMAAIEKSPICNQHHANNAASLPPSPQNTANDFTQPPNPTFNPDSAKARSRLILR